MVDRYGYKSGIKEENGPYVRLYDYETLEARCRELEAERDNLADKIRWMDPLIKEHHDAGQVYWEKWQAAQAHAQKLTEALKDTSTSLVGALSLLFRSPKTAAPSDKMFDQMLTDYQASFDRARLALALTPTSALADVRDEVTETMIDAGMQHYSEGGCSGLADYEVGEVVENIIDAAIRARKEAGV